MPTDHSVGLSLIVIGVERAIEFYGRALGAEVVSDNRATLKAHHRAELRLGTSSLSLSERAGDDLTSSAQHFPCGDVAIEIIVDNLDQAVRRAMDAGGQPIETSNRAFRGDTSFTFRDPFGYCWALSTFLDDAGPLCL